jgi:hypothetical protein
MAKKREICSRTKRATKLRYARPKSTNLPVAARDCKQFWEKDFRRPFPGERGLTGFPFVTNLIT